MKEQLMLQIAMEQLNLVILTMFEEWEYRQIVEDALYEIEFGIGEVLCGDADLKAALVLFLQGDRGGEAYHFRVYLESLNVLEHARFWADCEYYSQLAMKKPVTPFSLHFARFSLFLFLLVRSGRSRYRPWGASLRSTIVPSVVGGVKTSEN